MSIANPLNHISTICDLSPPGDVKMNEHKCQNLFRIHSNKGSIIEPFLLFLFWFSNNGIHSIDPFTSDSAKSKTGKFANIYKLGKIEKQTTSQ